jgi:hypothetical protein
MTSEESKINEKESDRIRKLPVQSIIPCAGCRFLMKEADPEIAKYYGRCTYVRPPAPKAYWQFDHDDASNEGGKGQAKWRNVKFFAGNGPFAADAKVIVCEVRESAEPTPSMSDKTGA